MIEFLATRLILLRARHLISTPGTWTQGVNYVLSGGERRNYLMRIDPKPVAFCGYGAIHYASRGRILKRFRYRATALIGGDRFVGFNDHYKTTHADVLAKFDKTIWSL